MIAAIDLEYQHFVQADKIDDEISNNMLTAEFTSGYVSVF